MVSIVWVSLPQSWRLEEVQAGLQVVVALLCTWGIFAFSRFCWQLSSNTVKKNRAVALASLMSINTIGEAYDVIALLKRRIFRQRYWKLLAQSIVVVALTTATIVSGPIAKASTRVGSVIKVQTVPGYLATNDFNSRTYANVDWNDTSSSLDRAGFPKNQLLDFMPFHNTTWLYRENEWNNSWKMECNKTESTPVTAFDSGQCGNLSVEIPVTNSFFPYTSFDWWQTSWNALYSNDTWLRDGMLVFCGWNYPGYDNTTKTTYSMSTTVALMNIHNMPKGNSSKCNFGRGAIESASYTKFDCSMQRPRTIPDKRLIAYPEAADPWALPQAFMVNYYDRMATESSSGKPITIVTPEEMIRFYQTYLITKDYQYREQVSRQLTSEVRVVQLSSTFIAFGGIYALMVILGLLNYGMFAYRHSDVMRETPESKLDWIVQSILDESEAQRNTLRTAASRRSVYAQSVQSETPMRNSEKVRTVFENAKYGATSVEEIPLAPNAASRAGSIHGQSPMPGLGIASPTPYDNPFGDHAYYNMNPYEASYASQQMESGPTYELQNPESTFTTDRRRGYARLG